MSQRFRLVIEQFTEEDWILRRMEIVEFETSIDEESNNDSHIISQFEMLTREEPQVLTLLIVEYDTLTTEFSRLKSSPIVEFRMLM